MMNKSTTFSWGKPLYLKPDNNIPEGVAAFGVTACGVRCLVLYYIIANINNVINKYSKMNRSFLGLSFPFVINYSLIRGLHRPIYFDTNYKPLDSMRTFVNDGRKWDFLRLRISDWFSASGPNRRSVSKRLYPERLRTHWYGSPEVLTSQLDSSYEINILLELNAILAAIYAMGLWFKIIQGRNGTRDEVSSTQMHGILPGYLCYRCFRLGIRKLCKQLSNNQFRLP
jgi:hypothetical protein